MRGSCFFSNKILLFKKKKKIKKNTKNQKFLLAKYFGRAAKQRGHLAVMQHLSSTIILLDSLHLASLRIFLWLQQKFKRHHLGPFLFPASHRSAFFFSLVNHETPETPSVGPKLLTRPFRLQLADLFSFGTTRQVNLRKHTPTHLGMDVT